jgi:crossover junction endodeoxyribonuclease RuvC
LRIIGIDPGLRHTGWGIIDIVNNKLIYVADGSISAPVSLTDGNRLFFIKQNLTALMLQYKPSISALEQIFVGTGIGSSLKLGMARGVALMVLAEAGLQTKELPPRLVKKTITGSGSASKEQIKSMVVRLLNITPKNEDSSDALAIAISAQHIDENNMISNNVKKNKSLDIAIAKALLKEQNIR